MEESNLFKWIDFYSKFATKLLEYQNDRQTLIEKIRKTYEKIGIKLPTLDINNHITDIDPFTVFGLFNKGIKEQNRIAIIQGLISEFSVYANVPDDFSGIPVLNNLQATFYGFEGGRQEHDIDNLWTLFEAAIDFAAEENEDTRERFCAAYDQALSQYAVKWNLTMGLYWIRPNTYLNLDSRNRSFLSDPDNTFPDLATEFKQMTSVPSAENYLKLRDKCRDAFVSGTYGYKSFPELSYKAWTVSTQPSAQPGKIQNISDAKGEIQYTWIDFYSKFASKLLEYKDDRRALIEKIQRTYKNINMPLPKLESDGDPVDIDPFTVFGLLNIRSDEARKTIIKGLISEFSIDAKVPNDFSGVAYNQHLMQPFYSITGNRKDDDIDNLWSMFEIAIESAENDSTENREMFCKLYDQVQTQWNVAKSLTAGLYWIRPYAYISLERHIQVVLKKPENLGSDIASRISSTVPSGKKYLDLRDSCLNAFSSKEFQYTSFPELSFKAWKASSQGNLEGTGNNSVSDKQYWLISWNPENWDWYDYDRVCAETASGNTFIDSWSCTSKKPKIGDEVFLIKIGSKPRGIIGHGIVHRESYSEDHYDPGEAEKGKQVNYIDVEFDCLLNHRNEEILFQNVLTAQCPAQTWSPQNSGIEIKPEVVPALQNLWKELTDNRSNKEDHDNMYDNSLFSKNMILYGPPGTGKTFNAVNYAVAICETRKVEDVQNEDYQKVLARYNQLKEEGRIAFTTFHQSYGYEEFIEGISPRTNSDDESKLEYEIRDGLFKAFCKCARSVKVQSAAGTHMKEQPRIWGMILGGTGMTELKKQCFANNEIRLGWTEVKDEDVEGDFIGDEQASWNAKHMVFDFKNSMEVGDIVVIEKNNKSIDAIGIITGEYEYDESHERYPRSRSVEWLVKDIDQDMVPFLPNGRKQLSRFSVFAFDYIGMDAISQIINEHTAESVVDIEQETKPYVFIIDEINRGNISKIFGELITLIEETKREGAEEAMEAVLPYSGTRFSVPNNVYILGTMNTADRSIALLDTALRRRFDFVEMMPDTDILKDAVIQDPESDDTVEIDKMLDAINKRIEILYDREHMIGHAYFMKLIDEPTLENLQDIFLNRIIPLLQEYFYDDYEKIQLVLGDNDKEESYKFILDKEIKFHEFFKGRPGDEDYEGKKVYRINKDAFRKLNSYRQIYE